MAHVSEHAWIRAVLVERGVRDLRQRPESVGEQQAVKAVIGCCGEFQQLLVCVPAAHYGGVYIQEVARQGAAEQSADLVSDSIVGMQDRPDGKLNWIVSTPVDSQLDLLLGTAFRAGKGKSGERLGAHDYRYLVPRDFKCGYDGGCQRGTPRGAANW
jgi:hypothetical protein